MADKEKSNPATGKDKTSIVAISMEVPEKWAENNKEEEYTFDELKVTNSAEIPLSIDLGKTVFSIAVVDNEWDKLIDNTESKKQSKRKNTTGMDEKGA